MRTKNKIIIIISFIFIVLLIAVPQYVNAEENKYEPMLQVSANPIAVESDEPFYFNSENSEAYRLEIEALNTSGIRVFYSISNDDSSVYGDWKQINYDDYTTNGNAEEKLDIYYNFYAFKGKMCKFKIESYYSSEAFIKVSINNSYGDAGYYEGMMYRKVEDEGYWNEGDPYIKILTYLGGSKNVVVPSFIDNVPVKVIDDSCFSGTDVESITISDGIQVLMNNVFVGCSKLKNITLSADVGFWNMGLLGCTALESINIPDDSELYVEDNTLYSKSGSLIYVFGGERDEYHVPSTVHYIEGHAFNDINPKKLYIPGTVTTFGNGPYSEEIHIRNGNCEIEYAGIRNDSAKVYAPAGGKVENYCKENNIEFIEEKYDDSVITFEIEDDGNYYFENSWAYSDIIEIKNGDKIGIDIPLKVEPDSYSEKRLYNGYRFVGWRVQGDSKTVYVNSDTELKDGQSYIKDYVASGDVFFVAVFEEASYNVTFRSEEGYINGEEDGKEIIEKVEDGTKCNNIFCNDQPGKKWKGWKTEGDDTLYVNYEYDLGEGEKYIGDFEPTKDTVFEAQWVEAYTIKFKTTKGYLDEEGENEYIINVAKNDPIGYSCWKFCEGYSFVGWKIEDGDDTLYVEYEDVDGVFLENYIPSSDITFIAQWEEAYNVTFVSKEGYDEGGNHYTDETNYPVTKDSKIRNWPYIERNGYSFVGWKIEGDDILYVIDKYSDEGIYIGDYVATKDTVFVAQWEEAWKVTFYSEEGGMGSDEEYYANNKDMVFNVKKGGKLYSYPATYRDGYIIKGWKVNGDDTIYTDGEMDIENSKNIWDYEFSSDVTFIAQWEEAYNITLHSDEGYMGYMGYPDSGCKDYTYQIVKGDSTHPSWNDTRKGYTIVGWRVDDKIYGYSAADNMETIWDYIPKGDVTLIAVWGEAWTVTFHSDEGYLGYWIPENTDSIESVEKGKNINSVPGTARPGYECIGWKIKGTDSPLYTYDDEDENYIFAYKPKSDVTFIAQWKKVDSDDSNPDNKKAETPKEDQKQYDQKKEEQKQEEQKQEEKKDDSKENSSSAGNGDSGNTSVNDAAKEYSTGDTAVDNGNKYTLSSDSDVIYIASEDNNSKNVTIPDTINLNGKEYAVTSIEEESFSNNDKVKKVIVGTNIKTIGKKAFAECDNLTTVTIKGSNLVKIEARAFQNCKKLAKITISKNVNSIGKNAFAGDKKLKSITIKSTKLKSIGKGAFKNINKKATIYVPKSLSKKQFAKYKKMFKNAGVPKTVKIKKK